MKRLLVGTETGGKERKEIIWPTFDQNSSEDLEQLRTRLTGTYIPFGTGFLVGKNYLLTNNHVSQKAEEAKKFIARFRYDRSVIDDKVLPVDYYFDSGSFVSSSPEENLDYTLAKLLPLGEKETQHLSGQEKDDEVIKIRRGRGLQFLEAGENFGWLPLFEDDALVAPPLSTEQVDEFQDQLELDPDLLAKAQRFGLPGEPVNIIQHPRGRSKEIVFYSNRVQDLTSRYLHYQADTDLGSSGSPVLNSQWQVIALHHAVLVNVDQDEKECKTPNISVRGSVGIRISEIVQDLNSKKQEQPQIKEFLDGFVISSGAAPKRGTIYILAGVKREEDIPNAEYESFNEAKKMSDLLEKIKTAEINRIGSKVFTLKDYGYSVEAIATQLPADYVPDEKLTSEENLIRCWAEQRNRAEGLKQGDLAIKLSMEAYTEKQQKTLTFGKLKVELSIGMPRQKMRENKLLRGVCIYYAGTSDEREQQAELLLKTILNQKSSQLNKTRSYALTNTV